MDCKRQKKLRGNGTRITIQEELFNSLNSYHLQEFQDNLYIFSNQSIKTYIENSLNLARINPRVKSSA